MDGVNGRASHRGDSNEFLVAKRRREAHDTRLMKPPKTQIDVSDEEHGWLEYLTEVLTRPIRVFE